MHQNVYQESLMSYWIVHAYDPSIDRFVEVYKSYGQTTAKDKATEYLKRGICAVVKHEYLPFI
jgi:hypothetical protein